jgi:hypothetical protein
MAVAAYTDLFNEAIDDLQSLLGSVTGLQVVSDPRNIVPGTGAALIGAPSFTAWSKKIVKMSFPIQLISSGPSNLDSLRSLLSTAALLLGANVAITDGHPITLDIGGATYPAYELNLNIQSQSA